MSANRAVTVLRSPPAASAAACSSPTRTDCSATDAGGFALEVAPRAAVSAAPHSPQNLNSGGLSSPQRGHLRRSAAPQLPQNFIPAGLSVVQAAHRIGIEFIPLRYHLRDIASVRNFMKGDPAAQVVENKFRKSGEQTSLRVKSVPPMKSLRLSSSIIGCDGL